MEAHLLLKIFRKFSGLTETWLGDIIETSCDLGAGTSRRKENTMILSQMLEAVELQSLTPEDLRNMILKLDEQIKKGTSGEKILFSIEANIVGIKGDRPAGSPGKEPLQQGVKLAKKPAAKPAK
jgi:hypothetical protein